MINHNKQKDNAHIAVITSHRKATLNPHQKPKISLYLGFSKFDNFPYISG